MNLHEKLLFNIKKALEDKNQSDKFFDDIVTTFRMVGVIDERLLLKIAAHIVSTMAHPLSLNQVETELKNYFNDTEFDGKSLKFLISQGLWDRVETVFSEIEPYLFGVTGKLIDYGAGSGLVGQMVANLLGVDVEAVDVRDFRDQSISVPFNKIDGYHVGVQDQYYQAGIVIHVLHHDEEPVQVIKELSRIVKEKLVVIETVSEVDNDIYLHQDWSRIFLNDVLWNRLFNTGDIPVPGSYHTPTNWKLMFANYGWQCVEEKFLGKDLKTIQDDHHLMVFKRK